ncbi:MAG TPA: gamma-glutamyl-gamma-aminobutyrate hydrolase family protein [Streptosporangiaceae bacterium]|nr:gamma-glutamyl-gamma-aminobutyrate hydrolase family protein [Streptosporangiaceae bacterium]
MEPRPLIGITSHLEPARWGDWVREAVVSPASYARAVHRAGGVPVVLPPIPGNGVVDLVRGLGGLILSAGSDVDPHVYGEQPHERTSDPDSRRDRFEVSLIRVAIEAKLPFLAICRGMQVLNVALGGSLIQHLPAEVGHDRHAPGPGAPGSHGVRISGDGKLGGILGTTAAVTASHHQAVRRLGDGLVPVAWADDQVVEGVELHGHPFGIGVQWRPEDSDDLRLFTALVNAAAHQISVRPIAAPNGTPAPAAAPAPVSQPAGHGRRRWRA